MGVQGTIDPGKAVMYSYAAISVSSLFVGFVSLWLKSRKKALYCILLYMSASVWWFFSLHDASLYAIYIL